MRSEDPACAASAQTMEHTAINGSERLRYGLSHALLIGSFSFMMRSFRGNHYWLGFSDHFSQQWLATILTVKETSLEKWNNTKPVVSTSLFPPEIHLYSHGAANRMNGLSRQPSAGISSTNPPPSYHVNLSYSGAQTLAVLALSLSFKMLKFLVNKSSDRYLSWAPSWSAMIAPRLLLWILIRRWRRFNPLVAWTNDRT